MRPQGGRSRGPLRAVSAAERTAIRSLTATVALGLLAGVFATGCPDSGESRDEQAVPRRGSFSEAVAETSSRPDRSLDPSSLQNMSELLAGILPAADGEAEAGSDGSGSPSLDPVWLEHGRAMDEIWRELDERYTSLRAWSETNLSSLEAPDAPLVYPFGGPDLITALQLFPDARSYILVGLEAPGRLPLPEEFSGDALEDDLGHLRATFDSLASSGYFVRSHIEKGVQSSEFDGVLPILVICLVRSGHLPLAVDYVGFDRETQEIQPLPAEQTEASAVRILFRRRGDALGSTRAAYYFAQDLSNRGLLSDEPFALLLKRQDTLNVYMKAAEYLPHTSDFLQFRKILLQEAGAVLQDDSGIPLRYFTSDRWNVRFFGAYEDVLAAYKPYFQEDLAAAFRKQTQGELPFRIGYNATGDGGGLILAVRKTEPPTPGVASTSPPAEPAGG